MKLHGGFKWFGSSIIAACIACPLHALPIQEADAFEAGDAKAIFDSTSGLTWIDYGVTNGKSFNQVVSEIGSTYQGWRLPTESEVKALWATLYSDIAGWNADAFGTGWGGVMVNSPDLSFTQITDIFSANEQWIGGAFSIALFQGDDGFLKESIMFDQPNNSQALLWGEHDNWGAYANFVDGAYSTFLVRDQATVTVPEPASIALALPGLACLFWLRRRPRPEEKLNVQGSGPG